MMTNLFHNSVLPLKPFMPPLVLTTTRRSSLHFVNLVKYLLILFILTLTSPPMGSIVRAQGSVQVMENSPKGTAVTSLVGTEMARKCTKPETVISKPDLLELGSNWSLMLKEEIDRETAKCEDSSNSEECVIKFLLICNSPFISEKIWLTILDINDNPPSFSKSETRFTMPENTAQETMFALDIATDPDSAANGVKRYSLECENCDEDSRDTFSLIDDERRSTDGAILPKIQLMQPLDHEEKQVYIFKIVAYDIDDQFDSYTLYIDVSDINDNSPIFSQSTLKSTIPEDQPVGSVVGSVEAHDLDSGLNGEIEFGFSAKESLPETMRCFQINSTTGKITLVQSLKNQGGKDHEVIIYAKDKAANPLRDELTWKFSILEKNDFVPQITFSSLGSTEDCQIPENNEVGSVIGYFEVTDKDEGVFGMTEFVMVNGSNLFNVSEENGYYFLKSLISFNREEQGKYIITVRAWDCRGDPTCDRLETTVPMEFIVCDENDNDPIFESREVSLQLVEEEPPKFLAQFEAYDKDAGVNGEIEYFIPETDISSYFSIDKKTGRVSSVKPLDLELLSETFEIPIAASDKGQPVRTSTARLFITLSDINDNAPRFINPPRSLQLFENSKPGTEFGTVKAVDDDKANAKIFYSLSDNSSDHFRVSKYTGKISAMTSFDYEDTNTREFDVWIVAQEDSEDKLKTILPVKIEIIDKNDNYPIIDFIDEFIDIPWDADDNFEVTRILAHDDDSGNNGRLNFVLRSERDRFDINRKTGVLLVRERADIYRDKDATFQVFIDVEDNASPYPFSTSATIMVTFSGNITLYNHTESTRISLPMTWQDLEGFIIYIALGTVLLVILIILLWVTLVFKCRRNSYKEHRTHLRPNNKFLIPEQDLQYQSGTASKRASAHFGSNLRSQNGGGYGVPGADGNVAVYLRGGSNMGDSDEPGSSKDISPNSALNVDDSVIFANEMNTSNSITNIHENPLAVVASSPSSGIGGLNSSQSSFDTTPSNPLPSTSINSSSTSTYHPHSTSAMNHPTPHTSTSTSSGRSGPTVSFGQLPSPLPKLKLDGQMTVEHPAMAMDAHHALNASLPYNYPTSMASLGGGKSAQTPPPAYYSTAGVGVGGTMPPNSIQMVGMGGGGVGRRQISEPADTSNLTVQFVPTDQPRRHHNLSGGGMGHGGSDVRTSGSPEPAGSDSSSFDSGRGSEAHMGAGGPQGGGPMDALMSGGGPGGYNQAGHLGTMRGAKSLPTGKKSRHAAPAPMYGDHRMEDDCWQPRMIQESNTLPSHNNNNNHTNNNRQQIQQQQQMNNPDIPTKGGILITPSRQILQPPASNHEKWNVPRDTTSTFKSQPNDYHQQQPTPIPNAPSSQPTNNSNNSNGNINRIGLSELEPIAENFALERKRDTNQQNYIPDIVKSSGQAALLLNLGGGSNQSLKQSQQPPVSYSPAPVSSVRTTLPPKRTPPSIPIENDPRAAVV